LSRPKPTRVAAPFEEEEEEEEEDIMTCIHSRYCNQIYYEKYKMRKKMSDSSPQHMIFSFVFMVTTLPCSQFSAEGGV